MFEVHQDLTLFGLFANEYNRGDKCNWNWAFAEVCVVHS